MANKWMAAMLSTLFPDRCTACDSPLFVNHWEHSNQEGQSVESAGWIDDAFPTTESSTTQSTTTESTTTESTTTESTTAKLWASSRFADEWCEACWQELSLANKLQCEFCAAEIRATNPLGGGCALCRSAKLRFDRAICLGNYAGLLRELVIRMKNQRVDYLGVRLAHLLAAKIQRQRWAKRLDLVVPVPTHWKRRLTRGFCAAELLAETICADTGLKLSRTHVRFARPTEKQGRLSIAKRRKNIVGAFELRNGLDITDKVILIVDDVMTSGATASELAKVLKKRGAAAVFVAVAARGAGVS